MQPAAGRDVRLYDRATRVVLSKALRGRKGEKGETRRTKAATPLRPDRLPMRCVHGLAISSGDGGFNIRVPTTSTSVRHRDDRTLTIPR